MKQRLMLVLAVGLTLIYAVVSVHGARLTVEIPRQPLAASPETLGLAYQNIEFAGRGDNPPALKGWFFPGAGDQAVVILNGGFRNRVDTTVDTLSLTADLVDRGYNVLLFDFRGRGESAGKGVSLMRLEEDTGGAVDFLIRRGFPAERVALLGFSSGAIGAILFGTQDRIGAVIADGPFNTFYRTIKDEASLKGLPPPLFTFLYPGMAAAAWLMYGFQAFDPIDVIGDVKAPILIIHSAEDTVQSVVDAEELLAAAGKPEDELFVVPGAGHSQSYVTAPADYIQILVDFLNRHLK